MYFAQNKKYRIIIGGLLFALLAYTYIRTQADPSEAFVPVEDYPHVAIDSTSIKVHIETPLRAGDGVQFAVWCVHPGVPYGLFKIQFKTEQGTTEYRLPERCVKSQQLLLRERWGTLEQLQPGKHFTVGVFIIPLLAGGQGSPGGTYERGYRVEQNGSLAANRHVEDCTGLGATRSCQKR